MTITYPYPLAFLSDLLRIKSVMWSIQRNDELSGLADGRVWQTELADPIWTAEVTLANSFHAEAEQIAARIRKLHGAQESFMLCNPVMQYPQFDPKGLVLAGSPTVDINFVANSASIRNEAFGAYVLAVASNRKAISVAGLPSSYRMTIADKGQITFGSPSLNYFFEFSETVSANLAGATAEIEVFPHVPVGVTAGMTINLVKPACKMFIMPDSFKAASMNPGYAEGGTFRAMERRR